MRLNLTVTVMSYPQDWLFSSGEIHPSEQLSFSSVRPYITRWGNTLPPPEKQHWFVSLLNFIAGWISSKTASVSVCLSDCFCISEKRDLSWLVLICASLCAAELPIVAVFPLMDQLVKSVGRGPADPCTSTVIHIFLYSILLSQCHGMFPG